MAAAFTVCKELHEIGQLTNNLIPVNYLTIKVSQLDNVLMNTDKDDSNTAEANTNQFERVVRNKCYNTIT